MDKQTQLQRKGFFDIEIAEFEERERLRTENLTPIISQPMNITQNWFFLRLPEAIGNILFYVAIDLSNAHF
jgi:hypothetical protein